MKIAIVVSGILLSFLIFFIWEMKQLKIQSYQVFLPDLPKEWEGCKMVHLSDLHGNRFGKCQERLFGAIKAEKPEYIMITGDMVTDCDDKSVPKVLAFLTLLAKEYTVLYEPGNHETRAVMRGEEGEKAYREFTEAVKNTGVYYLENEKRNLKRKGKSIQVYGLSLEKLYFGKFWNYLEPSKEHIEELLGKPQGGNPVFLLAHHPDYFSIYEEWGASLVLSGHIHGGIAKLPLIGGILSPVMRLFPKYDGGLYPGKREGVWMILSRGLGSHTIPLRPFNPPELVVFTLHQGKAETR